jgi:hypothetical protein
LKVAVFLAEIYKIKQYNSNNYNGLGLFKEALIIQPYRDIYTIKLMRYEGMVFRIKEYIESSNHQITFYKSENNFRELELNYNISKS